MQSTSDNNSEIDQSELKVQDTEKFVMPVSFSQQRLWLLDQLTTGGNQYNIPRLFHLTGALDQQALKTSLNELVKRHEVLRTCFKSENGQPMQVIYADYTVDLRITDLSQLPDENREAEAMEFIRAEASTPFDLRQVPLFRVDLIILDKETHLFLINIHHIIADGWSMSVINRELSEFYRACLQSTTPDLPELTIQYADFAIWQQEWLQGEILEHQLAFWRQQLKDASTLDLPTDHPRPAIQSLNGADITLELPNSLVDALKSYSQRQGVTLFMVLLSAFKILMQRYSQQDDIVIGSPMAGRNRSEVEGLIGFFINALVLRTNLSGDPDFNDVVSRVKKVCLDAYSHQDIPFEKLVEHLQAGRDLSRNPIFQVAFVLQNTPEADIDLADIDSRIVKLPQVTSKFDLTLSLREHAEGISGNLNYNTDLYDHSTVVRMMEHFVTLLESAVISSDLPVSLLTMESDQGLEKTALFGSNITDYPRDLCVHQQFEQQAEATPEAIACRFNDQSMSYLQLNQQANQLAHYLIELGVQPQSFVCLSMPRSMNVIISMLAILKVGATYVPLDDSYPHERLLYMIKDTNSPFLLTETELLNKFEDFAGDVVCVDKESDKIAQHSLLNPDLTVKPTDLAYIMYTSGSTGQPKGVEITHRGIVRLVCQVNYVNLGPEQRHLLLAPVSFDASTFEIWGALLNGASCAIYSERVPSLQGLKQAIADYRITTLWLTSSLFNIVVDEAIGILQPLQQLLVGGEALSVPHIRRAIEHLPDTQLINGYGPTENTTFTCTYKIPRDLSENPGAIPIGEPVSNTHVYILDNHQRPVAVGLVGELYIGGDGLARGYLNNIEVTKQKFIPDPFSSNGKAQLYRTGDRVRYLPNGMIDFVGRVDQQVKIRGYRIEPGEIETCLTNHECIQKSVVQVFDSDIGKQLVAYIEANDDVLDEQTVKSYLSAQLPEYMIPARVIKLDQIPVTQNGKVDLKQLPAVTEINDSDSHHDCQPLTTTEQTLIRIWSELLHRDTVGRYENFFALGGHSLLATQLISRLGTHFDLDIPLRQIFITSDISGLAKFIDQSTLSSSPSLKGISQQARENRNSSKVDNHDVLDSEAACDGVKLDINAIENRLIRIWEEVLSHRPIDTDSHFFEIGGHSLLGVKLVYEIEKAFNVRIPLTTLFEKPVLHQLSEVIEQNEIQIATNTLVAIKSTGSRSPLFCIHGRAEALVRYIDMEQPFYWLHQEPDKIEGTKVSIEAMARNHLDDIQTIQTKGPYKLSGFSVGGMLACEIAHQLEQAGEEVSVLALFDPTPPHGSNTLQERIREHFRSNEHITPRNFIRKAYRFSKGRLNKLRNRVKTKVTDKKIARYISDSKTLPPDLNLYHLVKSFKTMAKHYHYPVCHSHIVIFIPEGQPSHLATRIQKLENRWKSIAAGGLDIRVISGCARHSQIVEEPYVQDLMGQLNETLEKY